MQKRVYIFLSLIAAAFFFSSFAEAALQYLPRYQGSYGARTQSGGKDKVTVSCASKGGVEKGANQTCTGAFTAGGKTCYKSCYCDTSVYKYTVASHQGTGKLCASLSNACTDKNGTRYSICNENTCSATNSSWISENSKASYTSNKYTCKAQGTAGKDGTCYLCACPATWTTGNCPENSLVCESCKAISPYTESKYNLTSCKLGYYRDGAKCTLCPAGNFCNGTGKFNCLPGSYAPAGASSCTQCPAGQYSAAGATSCTNCKAGTYSVAGSSTCTECNAGTYSAAGAAKCTTCSDDKYSTKGSSSCISCSPKKANSTHSGCVDCATSADCTKVSGGTCSGGTCKYPVITCNSDTDRTNEKVPCGANITTGYSCSACTAQAEDGSQTSGHFNCTCNSKSMYPNGTSGSGTNGILMEGANYGIDTLCDGWRIVCPKSGCKAGYYYTGGGCLACTGNTYSAAKATACTPCPDGQTANATHTGCELKNLTCQEWVKANHPEFTVLSGGSNLPGGSNVLLTGNFNSNYGITLSGKIVGPSYFEFDKCKAMATPTITITSKAEDGVRMTGGTLANVNVEYDPVTYEEYGFRDSLCSSYTNYCSAGSSSTTDGAGNLYNAAMNTIGNPSNCDSYDDLCSSLGGCMSNNTFASCDRNSSYGSCSCLNVAQSLCYSSYLQTNCINNRRSALAGNGTVKDVKINSKKKDMDVVVYPEGGNLIIEGTVNIYGNSNTTPLRIGSNAQVSGYPSRSSGTLTVNGILDINSGRDLYYSSGGKVVVNAGGTLKIAYGAWGGIMFNYANTPMEVYGKLDISSFGSGGKYANDLEFTWNGKGVLNAYSGSCIKLQNGGGGTSSGGSGTFGFSSGTQLKMKGTCKKASTIGTYTVKNSSDNLYGGFTSFPSGFSQSCTNCD